jgi:hypothetical protein
MKCKVYGCAMKKCFCADEEACTRIDCSKCAEIANKCREKHVEKCAAEVRKWPQWKKDFAADVYGVDPKRFD